jgi:uncharacterized membrane protein YeaQ/YmgE (transglycosylase-associated protein family)
VFQILGPVLTGLIIGALARVHEPRRRRMGILAAFLLVGVAEGMSGRSRPCIRA